ncbi:hypothetical protein MUN89_16290 [Halobacillus salinarum]|uniref:Uncharacterized protein n=1 Tax=Halobacillus salinarum TaxID=2932257 RepID=A0ABY4EG64_9BACI|nr:hypothetical protein [Halobacillus salinarum]UOQ43463.1 hypothetical protein MUN89_16290 [Halobacillus salinarum]
MGAFRINITIPKEKLPEYGELTLTLYEASAKDGSPSHVKYIQLDNLNTQQ